MKSCKLLQCIALFFVFQCAYGQVPERVEPPNWWIGMHDPSLQIMVYGKNIGNLTPHIKYKGVKLIKASCPENKDYLFLDITIHKSTKPGEIPIHFFEGKKEITMIRYPLFNREAGSADRKGFNTSDVIYLITPDRFANGDPGNDDVEGMSEKANRIDKNGRHGGDIEGMRQHLDYISDLGCTAIWPMPVLENNMPRYSYHGYAITDFYKVDPRLGTNESYQSLCKEASKEGIKMIMDMIINHCGLEHWWMKNPPTQDWINYFGQPYVGTSHRKTIQMDPYAAPEDHDVFTKGWFVRTMPDLNPQNPYLGTYLIQNSIWWIEYAGLAGIRMDTYVYPDEEYMMRWSQRIMSEYPHFTITGEVWHTNPSIVAHWQRGKINSNGYISYLPSLFDFPIQNALRNALMTPDEGDAGWAILYETLAQDFEYPDPQNLVVFVDNHDMSRMYAQLKEDVSNLKMAIAFILTTRGIPQLFYGDEILMNSPERRDDGIVRSDFPGGWKGDKVNGFTGEGLTEQSSEMKAFVKKLLAWRKDARVVQNGRLMQYVPENGTYVFFRYDEHKKVMIILNKNETPVSLQMKRFKSMLGETSQGKEIISGRNIDLTDSLRLDQRGPYIIEIQK